MSNSFKKIPFVSSKLLRKIKTFHRERIILTWSRASTVVPIMIGDIIAVYNGKKHIPVFITDRMIGHKVGEFSLTRNFSGHK